jgi:hypothetical protein
MDEDRKLGEKKPIKCFCSRKPLLAMFGVDEDGLLYIHVKWYKGDKIYGEILARGGVVSLKCRDCFRWYKIFINQNLPSLVQTEAPQELQNDEPSLVEISNNVE